MMVRKRFVLLDRDGTLIVERSYLSDPDGVELIPGAVAALRELQALGFGIVVLTNQSGIGRGFFRAEQVEAVHTRLRQLLEAEGVRLDGIYVCPHVPDDRCRCRKPEPGLAEQAARDLCFDLREAFVVGDKACDIELGRRVGARTILVCTGYGKETVAAGGVAADEVARDLSDAARHIAESITAR